MPKFLYLILVFFLLYPLATQGDNFSDIIINEIAWMGTENSANDEWIELYNNSEHLVDLEGWKLEAEDGSPKMNLKGKILPKGFFLLERTNDETVPDIKADLIYKGNLNNKGEHLSLIGNRGKAVDEIDCSSGWFTGKGKPEYKTMERINPLTLGNSPKNWQTSKNPGGTPRTKNSSGFAERPAETGFSQSETAFIGEKMPEHGPRVTALLIAFAIAIFSAIVILILKKIITPKSSSDSF